jgi:predicted transcriptional regulator
MRRPERMRTKNPFCTGTQLAVLQVIRLHGHLRVTDMALLIKMSSASFAHALAELIDEGHLTKDEEAGKYVVTKTGVLLIDCAKKIEQARKQS